MTNFNRRLTQLQAMSAQTIQHWRHDVCLQETLSKGSPFGVLNNCTGITSYESLKGFPSRPLADLPDVRYQGAAGPLHVVDWRFFDAQNQR